MKHDPAAAATFLEWLYPRGPWLLTAIEPDRKGIGTATFGPDKKEALARWIDGNAARNIYYSVNLPRSEMSQKADRTEISKVMFLHVDVDPRVGEDFTKEQERIKKLFGSPPGGVPEPSGIVASGGGVNALWRLAEPLELDGTLDQAEQAKRFNLQLERIFGGDHCHNIDRILRLPGTVNWPNEKKRKKGQVPALARVLAWSDLEYPISRFTAAAPVQSPGSSGFTSSDPVKISGNIARLASLEELGDKVPEKVKIVIAQGMDPDKPDRWESRSEPLLWVCCELVRHGVKDEVIYSVITDSDYKISASVLDKGSNYETYALRQIKKAREVAIHPFLAELNSKHAVIMNIGGKCRVVQEVPDPVLDRTRLTVQSFEDFRNAYLNRQVNLGSTEEPDLVRLGKWWLEHPHRRQYGTVVFSPEKEAPDTYNLWQGFACEARPGNRHESFLKHVHDNICSGAKEHYDYLLGWLATAVQHPGRPGEVAIVLRGTQGTGKSFFVKNFGRLWGRHFLHVSDSKHLVGHFNAHLRDCIVLFGDEAFYAGDKKHSSILKTLVTEESITIEAKGRDMESSPNYVHLIMATNDEWAIPAGKDERRYFALDVAKTQRQEHGYFGQIDEDLRNGGLENLLYYLRTFDLRGFKVRNVPKTEALQDQKIRSMSPEEEWWFHKLEDGVLTRNHLNWDKPILKEALQDDYLIYSQKVGTQRRANATILGRFLHRVVPLGLRKYQAFHETQDERGRSVKERAYFYEFPPLDQCRQRWIEEFGPYKWPVIEIRNRKEESEVF